MQPWELEIVRRAYAKQVLAAGEITDARVEAAFAIDCGSGPSDPLQ